MKILVTGSNGFIGSALVLSLASNGHEVSRLLRTKFTSENKNLHWNPTTGEIDAAGMEGLDAVIHLAGENIASGRWTAAKKERIRNSRVQGTKLLCEALAKLSSPPKVLISASATGYYGDRGEEILAESSSPGSGFLAQTCRDWEAATQPAVRKGIRVVQLRFGVVLGPGGGALARMLFPFRMGVGGVLGNGKQYMSWISLEDAIRAIFQGLTNDQLHGPVNAVSPNAVTNREFTKTLGKVLSRPTIFSMPAFVVRVVFGEMADEALLASARARPARLEKTAFPFRYPKIEEAIRYALCK